MRRVRVIPTLLIDRHGGLVKTIQFGKRTYVGDPINAVKIFNEKEVDELFLLDIDASRYGLSPKYNLVEDIVSEAFMPVAYGGGIQMPSDAERLFQCGLEKVVLSSALFHSTTLVNILANRMVLRVSSRVWMSARIGLEDIGYLQCQDLFGNHVGRAIGLDN